MMKKIREKMLLLLVIGCLEAIKERKVTIDEAEVFLFLPRMCEMLKEEGYSEKLIHIIELGCELEDIDSLFPDGFGYIIDDIKKEALLLLDDYDDYDRIYWLEE